MCVNTERRRVLTERCQKRREGGKNMSQKIGKKPENIKILSLQQRIFFFFFLPFSLQLFIELIDNRS